MHIPDGLRDAIQGRRLIPFAGAGVSRSVCNKDGEALFPDWEGLLTQAAEEAQRRSNHTKAGLIKALLDDGDLLTAATKAREALGTADWARFLVRTLDVDTDQINPATLALPKALWALGAPVVITTNYDKVLRLTSPNPGDLNVWDIESTAGLAGLLDGTGRKPALWHLHGKIDNASRLILTPDGYEKLYGPDIGERDYKTALASLQSLLRSHTLLFVGFSFDDPGMVAQLRALNEVMQEHSGPHYALVRQQDADRVRDLDLPIRALPVEDFGVPMVEALRQLAALRDDDAGAAPTGADAPSTAPAADFDPKKRAFHIPFRKKGDQVIGRDAALAQVRKQLNDGDSTAIGQTAAFKGLGGLGKTQLAVEYAYEYSHAYPSGVVWLEADRDIAAQLIEQAELARWVAPASDHKAKLDIATQRVRTFDGGLVIFDNVERRDDIEPYLPFPTASPHLLLTSRVEIAGFHPIPLDTLGDDDAYRLLVQESGRTPDGTEADAARKIAGRLGGLPLALELAGAYLKQRPVTFETYRGLLDANLTGALGASPLSSFTEHNADLAATLAVHEQVLEEAPALRDVLDVLTWSASAPMSLSLMQALLPDVDDTALQLALGLGVSLRLLQKAPDEERYAVHRLLAEVRRVQATLDGPWAEAAARRLADWFRERRQDFRHLGEYEADFDHLDAWRQHIRSLNANRAAELLWLQAYPPYHWGQITLADERVAQALEEFRPADEWNALQAHLLHDRAVTLSFLGEHEKALELARRALVIRREFAIPHNSDIVSSLNIVSTILGESGFLDDALNVAQQALTMGHDTLGERHTETVRAINTLGVTLGGLGRHDEALEFKRQALITLLDTLGRRHPMTCTVLGSVAVTLHNLGRFTEALEKRRQALYIEREILGERHPNTAQSFDGIAITLLDLGRLAEAQSHAEMAVRVSSSALGVSYPGTLRYLRTLSTILRHRGQGMKARTLVQDHLARVGRDHPSHRELKDLQREIESTLPGFRSSRRRR